MSKYLKTSTHKYKQGETFELAYLLVGPSLSLPLSNIKPDVDPFSLPPRRVWATRRVTMYLTYKKKKKYECEAQRS